MRQDHCAGEKLFVDYAGHTVEVVDRATGEVREAQIIVAALGASSYTYAEATWTQGLADWVGAHVRLFRFVGGVAEPTPLPGTYSSRKHCKKSKRVYRPKYAWH